MTQEVLERFEALFRKRSCGAHFLCNAFVCMSLLFLVMYPSGNTPTGQGKSETPVNADSVLQRSALNALKGREGTVIVMDPQNGRIRALINSSRAFEFITPPGSTIKPFTTLAALRSRLVDQNTKILCGGKYKHAGFEIRCSHVKMQSAFDVTHALAYSCNFYFSTVGESLSAKAFEQTLAEFGFGSTTGSGDGREAAGVIPRGELQVADAVGEADDLRVSPAQMVSAYAALVNGGKLFGPREGDAQSFTPLLRSTIDIEPDFRKVIVDGMRGAVVYGTASNSGLASQPFFTFGKTGTSTPTDDYHNDGWFLGFATDSNETPQPENVKLAVLVFLKRARGLDAAEAANEIINAYAGLDSGSTAFESDKQRINPEDGNGPGRDDGTVRVRLGRQGLIRTVSVDEYVFGVLAAEGSTETEFEALKALAVVVRTYAMRNAGRHAKDGFDFCDNTHCERFRAIRDEGARPDFYALVHRAVDETSGLVLSEKGGTVADAYFSAACGGVSADMKSLWGVSAPLYLRGAIDPYCKGSAYDHWTDRISISDLNAALRADDRTDVGPILRNIRVIKQDHTGRAELIELDGDRRKTISGWDFKIIVGRTLGWNLLKSSRFELSRQGSFVLFRGSGFGHGLGLCQLGAHAMAKQGADFRSIIAQYFPGTLISEREATRIQRRSVLSTSDADRLLRPSQKDFRPDTRVKESPSAVADSAHAVSAGMDARLSLASNNFRASFAASANRRLVSRALTILEQFRGELEKQISSAGIGKANLPRMELFIHATTGDFTGSTGQPAFVAAVTNGRRINIQPLEILEKRRVLETALRHEYAHAAIEGNGPPSQPRWLSEGASIYLSGEGSQYSQVRPLQVSSPEDLESKFQQNLGRDDTRALYSAAYKEVVKIVGREGVTGLWRKLTRPD